MTIKIQITKDQIRRIKALAGSIPSRTAHFVVIDDPFVKEPTTVDAVKVVDRTHENGPGGIHKTEEASSNSGEGQKPSGGLLGYNKGGPKKKVQVSKPKRSKAKDKGTKRTTRGRKK